MTTPLQKAIEALHKAAEAFTDHEAASGREASVDLEALEKACRVYANLMPLIETKVAFTCERTGNRYEFANTTELAVAFLNRQQESQQAVGDTLPDLHPDMLEHFSGGSIDALDENKTYNLTGMHLKQILQTYRKLYYLRTEQPKLDEKGRGYRRQESEA